MPKRTKVYFPKSIRIGGHTIPIYMEDTGECMGYYRRVDYSIALNKAFYASPLATTLLHEALHACLDISGISRNDLTAEIEERVVRKLEVVLYDLIVNNPKFIDTLRQASHGRKPVVEKKKEKKNGPSKSKRRNQRGNK